MKFFMAICIFEKKKTFKIKIKNKLNLNKKIHANISIPLPTALFFAAIYAKYAGEL